jgi:pilus assembly protein Flp/PilA
MMRQTENVMALLRRFANDTSGVSAVEYAILIGGISVAIIVVMQSIGQSVFGFYSKVESGVAPQN